MVATPAMEAAAARIPWSGRNAVIQLSASQEQALGQVLSSELLAELTVLDDERSEVLARVTRRLAAQLPGKTANLSWRAVLVDGDEVFSFALPNGTVVVYRGMVESLATEAELTAVVAHDMAHVIGRHGAERITSELLLTWLSSNPSSSKRHHTLAEEVAGAAKFYARAPDQFGFGKRLD